MIGPEQEPEGLFEEEERVDAMREPQKAARVIAAMDSLQIQKDLVVASESFVTSLVAHPPKSNAEVATAARALANLLVVWNWAGQIRTAAVLGTSAERLAASIGYDPVDENEETSEEG